jgi:DNA mismatch repair protein MSH3
MWALIIDTQTTKNLSLLQNIVVTEDDLVTHLAEIRKLMREPRLEYTSVSGIDYLVEVKNKDVAKIPKSWVKISG